jgi:hypothetical protein
MSHRVVRRLQALTESERLLPVFSTANMRCRNGQRVSSSATRCSANLMRALPAEIVELICCFVVLGCRLVRFDHLDQLEHSGALPVAGEFPRVCDAPFRPPVFGE